MITQNYLKYNTITQTLELTSKDLFSLRFGLFVSLFLIISAGAHMLIAIPDRLNKVYNDDLEKGINKFR